MTRRSKKVVCSKVTVKITTRHIKVLSVYNTNFYCRLALSDGMVDRGSYAHPVGPAKVEMTKMRKGCNITMR
jgi:hypothetical protein